MTEPKENVLSENIFPDPFKEVLPRKLDLGDWIKLDSKYKELVESGDVIKETIIFYPAKDEGISLLIAGYRPEEGNHHLTAHYFVFQTWKKVMYMISDEAKRDTTKLTTVGLVTNSIFSEGDYYRICQELEKETNPLEVFKEYGITDHAKSAIGEWSREKHVEPPLKPLHIFKE